MDVRSTKRKLCIQQWQEIIRDRNNSGLTVDEYCNQNGLSRNSYFYWLRIIRVSVERSTLLTGRKVLLSDQPNVSIRKPNL